MSNAIPDTASAQIRVRRSQAMRESSVSPLVKEVEMVEAAGVEPSRRDSVNRLMAHDFHDSCLCLLARLRHSEFTPVYCCAPVSTLFGER